MSGEQRHGDPALAGIRVLEISALAASVAGRILADLGAEVIKIEPPGGEPARTAGEVCNGMAETTSWLAYNMGKKSICLDLTTDDGLKAFEEISRVSDIVVCDFERLSIGEMRRLADVATAANSALVWTEILPFGRGHRYESWPATDTTLQALGGHLYLNGDIDRPPVRIGLPVALIQSGSEAASAALMALYHAMRTGDGQRVDVSAQECIVWTLLNTTMAWQILALNEERGGAVRKERANRFYTRLVWDCLDGYVFFGPVGGGGGAAREKSYASLLRWMAEDGFDQEILRRHDWNGDGQFNIPQEDYDAVTAVIARFIATKSSKELMERAVADRILLAPVSSIADLLANPHFEARGLFEVLDDPARGIHARMPSNWVHMSASGLVPLAPAPNAGQHTHQVLQRPRSERRVAVAL